MASTASAGFDNLTSRIEQGQRQSLVRTIVLSLATVGVAGIVLFYTLNKIEEARSQLASVETQIKAANAAKASAVTELQTTQASLTKTQEALKAAEANASKLTQQVSALEGKLGSAQKALDESQQALASTQKALAEAADLKRHVYALNWGETKMMFVEFGDASRILEVITNLESRTHWGLSNTMAGGYTSPGFAQLVLAQLHKLPANGSLAGLPHDSGAPNIGDLVTYEGGYALFYFRDHAQKEFVIGMTPFGVTALTYDFGTKRTGVIRTGFGQH